MQNSFTVYMHTSPNGKRYIGITQYKSKYRWGVGGKRYSTNDHFWRAIQKYGWDNFTHEILYTDLTKAEACKIEQQLIQKFNTCDENYGYNLSIGGELSSYGCKRSDEAKEHYRQSKLGTKNPMYGKPSWNKGKKFSEESKRKMSESHKGHATWNKGKHLSTTTKQLLHNANIGKIYVNDGIKEVCITKEELETYLNAGYVRGYIKGRKTKKEKN